jgi:intracellular sulfur oxidation DsrE/DsrF family protein
VIYHIPVSTTEVVVMQVTRYNPFQEFLESTVRTCAKESGITVYFCDNTIDLRNITLEDLVIAKLKGTTSVR